jgi:hypothetical protein
MKHPGNVDMPAVITALEYRFAGLSRREILGPDRKPYEPRSEAAIRAQLRRHLVAMEARWEMFCDPVGPR